jgi:hypothetical protein
MSRGLGKHQLLILTALRSLESQHGEGRFYVSAVLKEAYTLSEELQGLKADRDRQRAEFRQRLKQEADDGDERASMMLILAASIESFRSRRGRKQEWTNRGFVENMNPSRVFSLLVRRGLVKRKWGVVGLTAAGRAAVASTKPQLPNTAAPPSPVTNSRRLISALQRLVGEPIAIRDAWEPVLMGTG